MTNTPPSTTTIRVSTDNRDRLNELTTQRGGNVDLTIAYLLDENWKARCIADWDRFREEDPQGWREYVAEADKLGSLRDGLENEPPYESDDPEWLAAGGAPLTKQNVVA